MDLSPPPGSTSPDPHVRRAGPSRSTIAGIVGVTALLTAGGLFVGSQLVGADRPSIRTVAATPTEPDPGHDELAAPVFGALDDVGECLEDQLGDLAAGLDDRATTGSVVVGRLGDDRSGGITIHDFGEGDGSVVVTKSGETITVETTGDVTTLDRSDIEATVGEVIDAVAACADRLVPLLDDLDLGPLLDELGPLLDDFDLGPLLDELLAGDLGPLLDGEQHGDPQLGDLGPLLDQLLDDEPLADLDQLLDDEQLADLGPLLDQLLDDEQLADLGPLLDQLLDDEQLGDLGPLLDQLLDGGG